MKVLVDLDRALAEGKITAEEHRRIGALAMGQGSDLALNILLGFGVTGVAAGFLALVPSAATAEEAPAPPRDPDPHRRRASGAWLPLDPNRPFPGGCSKA